MSGLFCPHAVQYALKGTCETLVLTLACSSWIMSSNTRCPHRQTLYPCVVPSNQINKHLGTVCQVTASVHSRRRILLLLYIALTILLWSLWKWRHGSLVRNHSHRLTRHHWVVLMHLWVVPSCWNRHHVTSSHRGLHHERVRGYCLRLSHRLRSCHHLVMVGRSCSCNGSLRCGRSRRCRRSRRWCRSTRCRWRRISSSYRCCHLLLRHWAVSLWHRGCRRCPHVWSHHGNSRGSAASIGRHHHWDHHHELLSMPRRRRRITLDF